MGRHETPDVLPLTIPMSERKVVFGLAVATALLLSPLVLVPPEALFGEGTAFFGQPYSAMREQLLQWRQWPLWDPTAGSGDPLLANPYTGQWYPPAWLILLAPSVHIGLRWICYLHLIAAAVGIYRLARELGAVRLAAWLAPPGFLWNSYITSMLLNGLPAVIYTLPWLSWGSLFLWRGLTTGRDGALVAAGLCLGAQILGGTTSGLQFTLLVYGALILGAALTGLSPGPWRDRVGRMSWALLLVAGCAVGLSAVKLLALLEYQTLFNRHGLTMTELLRAGQTPTPVEVRQMVMALFGAAPRPMIHWINAGYLLCAAAAVLALRHSRLRHAVWILIGLLVPVLWAAAGDRASLNLYAVLYYGLPGLRYSGYPSRVLIVAWWALPLLASVGATMLLRWGTVARRGLQLLLVGWVAVVGVPVAFMLWRHPYARLELPRTGPLAVCSDARQVAIEPDGTLNASVVLRNIGNEPWVPGQTVRWSIGDTAVATTCLTRRCLPSASLAVSARAPVSHDDLGPAPLPLTVAWGPSTKDRLVVGAFHQATGRAVSWQPAGPGTVEALLRGETLLGDVPTDWNALCGLLARWHAPERFRVYGDGLGAVWPYSAGLSGFQMMESTNYGMAPRYYWMEHWLADREAIRRNLTIFRLLNVRYLLMSPSYAAYLDPERLQVRRAAGDRGSLYELRDAMPRVWIPRAVALLVGRDLDGDFNSLEAKMLVYHSAFDPAIWAICWRPHRWLEDFTLEELRRFSVVVLTRPTLLDPSRSDALLAEYQRQGGRVIRVPYSEHRSNHPHVAAASMIDNVYPAKALSPEGDRVVREVLSARPEVSPAEVRVLDDRPGRWRLSVTTAREITPVVLSETYYPGWGAWVNGRPVPVYMVDGIVKGVVIHGAGTHTVELRYDPIHFRFGGAITLLTLGALLCTRLEHR